MKTSKTCRECKEVKSESEFYSSGHKTLSGKIIIGTLCKPCTKIYKKKRNTSIRKWLHNYKKKAQCEKCGYSNKTHASFKTSAIEFHHAQGNKDFAIANSIRKGVSIERIKEEIGKCVVLCSRCHAEIHSNERHNL